MAEQRLLYSLEGDASGLKKALAEAETAQRRLTEAMTRKGVEITALKGAEDALKKINAAAAEAKQRMDFFRRSAEFAPGGIKLFSKDIDRASKDLEKLARQARAQRATLDGLKGAVGAAGAGVVAGNIAQKLAEVNAAAAQTRVAFDNALVSARNFGRGGQSAAQGVGGQLKSIALQAIAVTSAYQGLKSVVETGVGFERATSKLLFANAGDAQATASDLAFVRAEAQRLALPVLVLSNNFGDLNAAVQGTKTSGKEIREIFSGISQAARVLKLPEFKIDRAFLAIQQALSKEKLQADELTNQLAEAIPGPAKLIARGLGIEVSELLKRMKNGAQDSRSAINALVSELNKLSDPALNNSLNSFQAKSVLLSNSIIDFKQNLAEAGLLDAFKEQIDSLTAKLREMSDSGELQVFAKNLAQVIGDLARILGAATRAAIEHRDALGTLAILYAGFRIAKAVQGIGIAWATTAASTAAAGAAITGVGGAVRILAALLGGPVGITVAILTAAAAWETFREKATDALNAAKKNSDDLRKTLTQQITEFNKGGTSGQAAYAQATKSVADATERLLALKKEGAALDAKLAAQGLSSGGLARSAARQQSEDGISRAKVDLASAEQFVRESGKLLNRDDTNKKPINPVKATGTGAPTRLPDLRAEFSAELELTKSALDDQAKVLETALAGQLISVRQYWLAKRGITEQQLGLEQKTLEKQLADQEDLIRRLSNFERRKPGVNAKGEKTGESAAANQGEALEGKLLAARNKAAELRVQLEALNGKKITTDFELKVNTDKAMRDIADAVTQARDELAKLQGTETDAQRKAAVTLGFRDLISKLGDDAAAVGLVNKLIDVKAASANLDELQRKWQLALEAMRNAEQSVDIQQKQGLITTVSAQNQIAAAHRVAATELEKLLPLMDAAANAIGEEAVAKVVAWKNELAGVKTVLDPVAQSINTDLKNALSQVFIDVGSSAKTAKEAVLDFARSFFSVINKAASQQLGESLFNAIGGSGGANGGVGGFISSLFGTAPGGKRDGGSVSSALYVQDVAKGGLGALTGTKGAEGGLGALSGGKGSEGALGDTTSLFGGLFESIKGIFSGIGSTISGLFKSLASSIAGFFSSSGGGGTGSSAGGWISSLISIFSSTGGGGGGGASFASGGYTGDGGKYEPKGVVHGGEYVFNKDAVRRLGLSALDNMHRIASGSFIPRAPRLGYADGGLVNLPGSAPPNVTTSTKVVNMFDLDSALAEYLNTRGGERAILNVIQRNPGAVGA